ncbi:MAG: hypothetical protein ACI392_03380 [Paludibacteraceae bacterium]
MFRFDHIAVQKQLRAALKKVADVLFTKNMVTFLSFLLLSTLFWVMYNVGTRRVIEVEIPMRYVGVPDNILLNVPLPSALSVTIKDEGQVLMNYKLMTDPDTLIVNLHEKLWNNDVVSIDYRTLTSAVRVRLPETSQIVALKPEIVVAEFVRLEQQLKPVRLVEPIRLAPSYVFRDAPTIVPHMVEVFAPQNILDTLDSLLVLLPDYQPLNKSVEWQCPLAPVDGARFATTTVTVSLPVEMSTEKILDIPVRGRAFPDSVMLRSFPAVVQVTASVGLSHFPTLTADDFEAVVDFADTQNSTSYKLPVTVSTTNEYVNMFRFAPTEVEFLLEK